MIGKKGVVVKTITEKDLELFKQVSLDDNRLHFDEEYAKTTRFKKRIAHGLLTGSLISAAIGSKLFTENIIYTHQNFEFLRPVYIGDTITATAEVIEVNGKDLTLSTYCVNQDGKTVLRGTGKIIYEPKEEAKKS